MNQIPQKISKHARRVGPLGQHRHGNAARKNWEPRVKAVRVQLDSWPKSDPCRKTPEKGGPKTCHCTEVLDQVGTQVAAFRDKRCGGKLKVMNRETGDVKTVTVVDAGPYVKDPDDKTKFLRLIDLHQDVFGDSLFHVCVSPYQAEEDKRLQNCWDGFGGQAPKMKPKKKPTDKKPGKKSKKQE